MPPPTQPASRAWTFGKDLAITWLILPIDLELLSGLIPLGRILQADGGVLEALGDILETLGTSWMRLGAPGGA